MVVTGASGQDGLIATELLTRRGFEVYAVVRDSVDLVEMQNLIPAARWLSFSQLTEAQGHIQTNSRVLSVIHLAAQTSVQSSWKDPLGTLAYSIQILKPALLLAQRTEAPLILAGSSQMFSTLEERVSETTAPDPGSPYGLSKLVGHRLLDFTRKTAHLRGSNVVLFNHDSPLRAPSALMPQLASQFTKLIHGHLDLITVPNPALQRDFSWAPDFVRVICSQELWESGEDIILASGNATSIEALVRAVVRDFSLQDDILSFHHTEVDYSPTTGDPRTAIEKYGLRQTIPSSLLLSKIVEMLIAELRGTMPIRDRKRAMLRRLVDDIEG